MSDDQQPTKSNQDLQEDEQQDQEDQEDLPAMEELVPHVQSEGEVVRKDKNNSNENLNTDTEIRRFSINNNSNDTSSSSFPVKELNKSLTEDNVKDSDEPITINNINTTVVLNDNSDLNTSENNNSYKDSPSKEINCNGSLIKEEKIINEDCVETVTSEIDNNKANVQGTINSAVISLEDNGNDIKSLSLSGEQLNITGVIVNDKTRESEEIVKSVFIPESSNGITNLDNSYTNLLSSFGHLNIDGTPVKHKTSEVNEQNVNVKSSENSPIRLLEISAHASPNELDKTASCIDEDELDLDDSPKQTENGDISPKSSSTLNDSDRENTICTLSPAESPVKNSYSEESCPKSLSTALSTTVVIENSTEFLPETESSVKNLSVVIRDSTESISPKESPENLSLIRDPVSNLAESHEINLTPVKSTAVGNSEGDCNLPTVQSTIRTSLASASPSGLTENSSIVESSPKNSTKVTPSDQIESTNTSSVVLDNSIKTSSLIEPTTQNVGSAANSMVIGDPESDNILLPTASPATPSVAIKNSSKSEEQNFGPDSNFNFKMTDLVEKVNQQQAEISDLKLKLNAAQQHNASLELQIRQNEEIVIKTQAEALKTEQNYQQEVKQLKQKINENSKIMDKDRIQELEEQIKEAKAREAKLLAEIAQRTKDDVNYQKIMNQYEVSFKMRLADTKKLQDEHETVKTHLANLELAFSDVHSKYEKAKAILQGLKANEEQLLHDLELAQSTNIQHEERYESLKAHAKTQIEKSNKEIHDIKEQHDMEVNKLRAFIRRLEIKVGSLEVSLQQKTEECEQLSALCDEVTGKKV